VLWLMGVPMLLAYLVWKRRHRKLEMGVLAVVSGSFPDRRFFPALVC
jgi:hypothetical protein